MMLYFIWHFIYILSQKNQRPGCVVIKINQTHMFYHNIYNPIKKKIMNNWILFSLIRESMKFSLKRKEKKQMEI